MTIITYPIALHPVWLRRIAIKRICKRLERVQHDPVLKGVNRNMGADQMALAERQAAICSVFANARRILIWWTLAEQEQTVSQIATAVDISLQNASQHLKLMRDCGLLQSQRDGHTVRYRIAEDAAALKCCGLIDGLAHSPHAGHEYGELKTTPNGGKT